MKLYDEIEKLFPKIEKYFCADDINIFTNCEYENLFIYHFGFGTWIRNTILIENSPLYNEFINANILQKDTMSSIVINSFYIYMQAK